MYSSLFALILAFSTLIFQEFIGKKSTRGRKRSGSYGFSMRKMRRLALCYRTSRWTPEGERVVLEAARSVTIKKSEDLDEGRFVKGEEQKKLDLLSNEVFIKALTSNCILVLEEDEEATFVDPSLHGRCTLLFEGTLASLFPNCS